MTKNQNRGAPGRLTRHIGHRVTQSAFRAFDYAKDTGQRLNTYVVINLRDEAARGAVTAFSLIRHKFRDWLTYKSRKLNEKMRPIYVYSFENPKGNIHVNWVIHIPHKIKDEFAKKIAKWLERVQGPVGKYDLCIKDVNVDYDKYLAKYILKGTNKLYLQHFYLDKVYKGEQGEISGGRRAGISQAIGIQARKKACYHPGKRRPYKPHGVS